jgi:hypothetical protein
MTVHSRKRRYLSKLVLVVFGFLLGAVVAEIGLRVMGYSYPEFYMVDESRGYALRPGMEGWYRKEGEAYIRINRDGLRDREHPKAKPPDTFRIALLGDSYPEAFPVPLEEAFWMVMEKRLEECSSFSGRKIEVINFGVSGYGTAQELITLQEHVWQYSPDVVMLAVTTNNDITDNSRVLKKTDRVPYFFYRDRHLVLDDSFKNTRKFRFQNSAIGRAGSWIYDHSRLVQAISQAHLALKILMASRRSHLQAAVVLSSAGATPKVEEVPSAELGLDNAVYLEPRDAIWNDAWRVTEDLIVMMASEVKDKGAKFVVVTLSNGPQVLPIPEYREDFMKRLGISDLLYPDNRIKVLGARNNILVITLAPDLQAYAERNKIYLHGFQNSLGAGHWNHDGHRVAGEVLAQKFCNEAFAK